MITSSSGANAPSDAAALEAAAIQASKAGKDDEAVRLWNLLLELQPQHTLALTTLGKRAFRLGDHGAARRAFERLVRYQQDNPQHWVNLAMACQGQRDEKAEELAIHNALVADPHDMVALLLRANLLERQGKTHKSATAYGAVAQVAPPLERLDPNMRSAVEHAHRYIERYQTGFGNFLDEFMDSKYREFAGEDLQRFRDSIDLMVGRKRRYDSHSMMYHYPGLVPVEFFPRAQFPWLDAIEAGTDTIRDEFLQVLQAEQGFQPYLTYPDDVPHNQFAELNNSPRWSAFHLIKDGRPVAGNIEQCPKTMELLRGAPQPDQPGRTPTVMFSLLKPRTRIPPHVGVSNARLLTHVPLIIPSDCGFRVGNTTRAWVPGQAWVFDDTIEHEAWNNSDKLRVIMIFDIWHPQLSLAERSLITELTNAIYAFNSDSASYET